MKEELLKIKKPINYSHRCIEKVGCIWITLFFILTVCFLSVVLVLNNEILSNGNHSDDIEILFIVIEILMIISALVMIILSLVYNFRTIKGNPVRLALSIVSVITLPIGLIISLILNYVALCEKDGRVIAKAYKALPENLKSKERKKNLKKVCELNNTAALITYLDGATYGQSVVRYEEIKQEEKLAQAKLQEEKLATQKLATGQAAASQSGQFEERVIDPVKEKRADIITTVVMGVIYLIILVLGILGICKVLAPVLSSMAYVETDMDNIAGSALSMAVGWMFISFIPTIAYYFAFTNLYSLKKLPRVGIFLGGLVASLAMVIVFFVVYKSDTAFDGMISAYDTIELVDGSAWEQTFTVIVAHIGMLLTYLLTFVRLDTKKLNEKLELMKQNKQAKGNSLMSVIQSIVLGIEKFCMKFLILILKLKDNYRPVYYALFTIIFTILCFISAWICIVVIAILAVALVVLSFSKFISFAYIPSPKTSYSIHDSQDTVYEIYENGSSRKLTYCESYGGKKIYKDDVGDYWTCDENGMFYRDN